MWDPFTWSLPLGRIFGINVRVHVFFPVVALGLILHVHHTKDVIPGSWQDAAWLMGLLFVAVLCHEFGHCFGSHLVDGDAHQILIWPLGGLAGIEVPPTARANLIATLAGPIANLLLCLVTGSLLSVLHDPSLRPPLSPFWSPCRVSELGTIDLTSWDGTSVPVNHFGIILLARFFFVNWILFLLNVLLVGFPLDGGRILQCILWPWYGFRQATLTAIFVGFVTMFVIFVFALAVNELLPLVLAWFIFVTCRQQWIILETGGEESFFGYDFSQGYTSLEREEEPRPRRRRANIWQRWQQRRASRKLQLEQETRIHEERRMDELLQKVQLEGLQSLTEEERRFLKRVSDKFRNRQ